MKKVYAVLLKHRRVIRQVLFGLYMLFIIYYTILSRHRGTTHRLELRFMWAYREILEGNPEWQEDIWYNIANILFFVPFGFLYPWNSSQSLQLKDKRRGLVVTAAGLILSFLIEITQYMFYLGLCELDDIICNGLGALIGYCIYLLFTRICFSSKWR